MINQVPVVGAGEGQVSRCCSLRPELLLLSMMATCKHGAQDATGLKKGKSLEKNQTSGQTYKTVTNM